MVRAYTDKQLLDKVKTLRNFKSIPSEHWILGVRSNEDTPNRFDDKFYLFKGEQFIAVASGTTNPGTLTLKQFEKVNKSGAAVVVADSWYYNLWKFGKHNGKVDALLQLGSSMQSIGTPIRMTRARQSVKFRPDTSASTSIQTHMISLKTTQAQPSDGGQLGARW